MHSKGEDWPLSENKTNLSVGYLAHDTGRQTSKDDEQRDLGVEGRDVRQAGEKTHANLPSFHLRCYQNGGK